MEDSNKFITQKYNNDLVNANDNILHLMIGIEIIMVVLFITSCLLLYTIFMCDGQGDQGNQGVEGNQEGQTTTQSNNYNSILPGSVVFIFFGSLAGIIISAIYLINHVRKINRGKDNIQKGRLYDSNEFINYQDIDRANQSKLP